MWYLPRLGFIPEQVIVRRGGSVTRYTFPRLGVLSMKRRKVGAGSPTGDVTHLAPMESNIFAGLGNIVAHCGVVRYEDGEPRRPGWITIRTLGSAWQVQVKDPDAGAQMSCVSDTLDNALAMADLLLSSEDAPWEPDPWLKRQGSKKGG